MTPREKLKAPPKPPGGSAGRTPRAAPMLPFYLIATAIVIGAGVFSYRQTARQPLDVRSQANAKLPPRPATEPTSTLRPQPFKGEGPWVLAALPGCFEQTQRVDGPKAFVHARLPRDAALLAVGSTLTAGDCALSDDRGAIVVTRRADRFRLTPDVSVYRGGDGIVTYRENGQLAELRMYRVLK